MSIFTVSLAFFYYQYHSQLLHKVIPLTLSEDFQCAIESTKITSNDGLQVLNYHFYDNAYLDIENKCHVEVSFTPLNDLPINDINSVNKTILNINQKLFVNLNMKKL